MAKAGPYLPDRDRYTKAQLQQLMNKAEAYVSCRYSRRRCKLLGRDKSTLYFNDIFTKHGDVEKPYIKDNHGDPRNPINGRIDGLFFNASVDSRTGGLPDISIYGEWRYTFEPWELICSTSNLYFADFYCTGKPHYVELVLTSPGSFADEYCQNKLMKLDLKDNPFFFTNDSCNFLYPNCPEENCPKIFYVPSGSGIWIEILFTGQVEFFPGQLNFPDKWGTLQKVPMVGSRSGGSTGLRKNPLCSTCNIFVPQKHFIHSKYNSFLY